MISLPLIFIFCLLASIFFSGAEMAFVSANLIKFRELSDGGSAAAKRSLALLDKPQEYLTVVLVGNNIVNITATAIFTYFLEVQFGISNEWIVAVVMAPLLIIVCETVPKEYTRIHSQDFLMTFSYIMFLLLKITAWPVRLILRGVDLFLGPLGTAIDRSIFVSEKEFRLVIEESAKSGVLANHEKQLIDTIMDFERIKVESVMTPLAKTPTVDITGTVGKVKEIARETQARMVFVSEDLPDLIVGMIYVFDVLFETDEKAGFKKYLRSPVFLSKNTSIEKAFLTLQEKRQSYAAVTNDEGDVIGAVAIEKLFSPPV